jgi:hypothetical protein
MGVLRRQTKSPHHCGDGVRGLGSHRRSLDAHTRIVALYVAIIADCDSRMNILGDIFREIRYPAIMRLHEVPTFGPVRNGGAFLLKDWRKIHLEHLPARPVISEAVNQYCWRRYCPRKSFLRRPSISCELQASAPIH